MMLLLQTPPINDPTITWGSVALAFIALLTPLVGGVVYFMKKWADTQMLKMQQEIELKTAVHVETLRGERVATAISVAQVSPIEIFSALYIGSDAQQLETIKLFRQAGIVNKVMVRESARDGYLYLKDHPNILFAVIYAEDIVQAKSFLNMVIDDEITKDIPVIFIDGNTPETQLAVYRGGGAGSMKTPLDIGVLLELLSKQNMVVTISREP